MRWQFEGETPLPIKAIFGLFMCNLLFQLGTAFAISRWSPHQPDAAHSYPIRWRGGIVTFVHPWLGKYFEYGFWAHFVLLALLFVGIWWYRNKVERVG